MKECVPFVFTQFMAKPVWPYLHLFMVRIFLTTPPLIRLRRLEIKHRLGADLEQGTRVVVLDLIPWVTGPRGQDLRLSAPIAYHVHDRHASTLTESLVTERLHQPATSIDEPRGTGEQGGHTQVMDM